MSELTPDVVTLRKKYLGYRPFQLAKVKGLDMLHEFTSWPFRAADPDERAYIYARVIGDPTTNKVYELRRDVTLIRWSSLRQKAYREGFAAGFQRAVDEQAAFLKAGQPK